MKERSSVTAETQMEGGEMNSTTNSKHGIAIRNRKTKELIEFIECDYGKVALRVLGGVRINMDTKRYIASEEVIAE